MLHNNLDPEVAERPEDLVVYGGTGKAARDWPSFHAIARELTDLRDDETLLVQSGRPVGVLRTHEWAPRVLIANSNLVPDWANWPEFRRLEALGLTMYGQMTAGSWIYIGTQGILQGTYETFAAVADEAVRRHAGRHAHADRGPGRHGRRAAAGRHDERRRRAVRRGATRAARAAPGGDPLPGRGRRPIWTTRSAVCAGGQAATAGRCRSALDRQRRRGAARTAAAWRRDRHRHRPDLGARPAGVPARRASTWRTGTTTRGTSRTSSPTAPGTRWPTHVEAMVGFQDARRRGLRLRQLAPRRGASSAATSGRSTSPASCPPTSGRCSARARARSAGRRCPATRPTSPPPTGPMLELFPENEPLARVDQAGRRAGRVPGTAGADLLARLRRAAPGRPAVQRDGAPAASCPRRS